MALVASNFEGRQRGTALGILGSVIGISSASGPLIGGYLVEHFGWPSIFYVNVPVGIVTVIMTIIFVQETPSYGENERVDLWGMLLSAAGLFSIIYGLIVKESHPGWPWLGLHVGGWLVAGLIIMVIFVVVESRLQQPMLNVAFFKEPHFIGTVIVAFALGAGIYSFSTFLTALMQNYIGYSALATGVRQLTISMWSLILGPLTGILGARFPKKRLIGFSLLIGAMGFLAIANAVGPQVSFANLWPGMVLIGITNGMVNPLLNTAGMEGVAPQEMGMASGLINVFRQLGTTVGVVGFGLVQDTRYEQYLSAHLNGTGMPAKMTAGIHAALVTAGPFSGHSIAWSARLARTPFVHAVCQVVLRAYDRGMGAVALCAAAVVVVGSLAALLLMRGPVATDAQTKD